MPYTRHFHSHISRTTSVDSAPTSSQKIPVISVHIGRQHGHVDAAKALRFVVGRKRAIDGGGGGGWSGTPVHIPRTATTLRPLLHFVGNVLPCKP